MTNQETEACTWRRAMPSNGTSAIPDIKTLTNEQLDELAASIAAERKDRQQQFIAEAEAVGLRLTPRKRKPRRRHAPAADATAPATEGASS